MELSKSSTGFKKSKVKARKIKDLLDDDTNLKYYVDFAESDEYKAYLSQTEDSDQNHKDILLQLYLKFCIQKNQEFSPLLSVKF